MSKTEMNGRRDLRPISKQAVKEFCQKNEIRMKELAEISGYASLATFSRALSYGYIQAAALSNLYQFFGLPKGFFDGVQPMPVKSENIIQPEAEMLDVTEATDVCTHRTTGLDLEGAALPKVTVIDADTADKLLHFYGDVDYEALFVRLLWADYERNKDAIARKRYEGMTTEELIAELIRRDAEAQS